MNKIKAFFERIGLPADTEIAYTYEFLKKVQYAAVTHIAYENLDILDGIEIRLDSDSVYDKIVNRKRGGYCFEVNGLLADMLREMGFKVSERFARYLRGEEGVPMRRHRVVIAECEDVKYMCDIGIGQTAPRYPVRLCELTEQEQFGEIYRFERDGFLGWVLCDLHKGEWRRFFSFTDEDNCDVDFTAASFWCEHHPDSPFNKEPMLAIKTTDGRKSLDGRTYKVFAGDVLTHIEENVSDARFDEIVRNEFLIG